MDPKAIGCLRESLAAVVARGTALTADFYAALFARYPGVRVLFPADMKAQEVKLLESLQAVIDHLEDGPDVRQRLVELGRRHYKYGALPEHYPIVCSLLLETMAKNAGAAWTAELAAEWDQALRLVSEAMISGSQQAEAEARNPAASGPVQIDPG